MRLHSGAYIWPRLCIKFLVHLYVRWEWTDILDVVSNKKSYTHLDKYKKHFWLRYQIEVAFNVSFPSGKK